MKKKLRQKAEKKTADPKDELLERLAGFRADPREYFAQVLGIKHIWRKPGDLDDFPGQAALWHLQEDLLLACPRAIRERKTIYVGSGHSCGKDYVCGGIALWFLQCFMPSLVVQTAPGDRQVKNIMWKETRSHWDRKILNLGGRAFTQPRIEIEKDWYLEGFATKETGGSREAGGAKFQGYKGKDNVCVIVTEAQAVEEQIYDQIDAITTGANILVIFLGNPTRAKGRFAAGLRDKKRNIVIEMSSLETPNYIERRSVIPGLASYDWVETTVRPKWNPEGDGEDPRWQGRVLGKIPEVSFNSVFPRKLIEHMKERHSFLGKHSDNRGVALDPAGEGVDENVFMSGSGGDVMEVYTKTLMAPSVTAIKAIEMCKAINGNFVIVDCDGLGIGHYQELMRLPASYKQGIEIIKFHGSAPSAVVSKMADGTEKLVYANVRTEAAFAAAERGQKGRAAINPDDVELIEDLEAEEYFEKKGVIHLIDKDDMREQLTRSPGRGDAWKMLQYAFDMKIKGGGKSPYEESQPLPKYATTDTDVRMGTLPTYGVTS